MEISQNMNKISDPLEYIIWCCENDFKPSSFDINNAKNELKKLRGDSSALSRMLSKPVAYGKTNDRFDLYDLRIVNNPYEDQTKVVPLYANKEEFLSGDWKGYDPYGKLSK